MKNRDLDYLSSKARAVREGIVRAIGTNNKGHLGGSMSSADVVTALYFYKMNHWPNDPRNEDRDRFIFSKGHSVLAQYAALAECGYFPVEALPTAKQLGSFLQGHPERDRTPGIEANTGSLGQGLSVGLGMALAGKLDQKDYKVYVIVGDAELAEGQIWEAATTAAFYKTSNLVAIVDHNKMQATGVIADMYDIGQVAQKFAAFGWRVLEIDGHDMEAIVDALDAADENTGQPVCIVAHTVKGKGVSFAEHKASFHNGAMTPEQYEQALEEIALG
ncbi:MAG: transketolase [Firmicutes bacterium]|nr:transketolase [Bacillota bacterium]